VQASKPGENGLDKHGRFGLIEDFKDSVWFQERNGQFAIALGWEANRIDQELDTGKHSQ
jgi:hypothetical protein